MDWRFWFSFHGRMRRSHWWLTRLVTWGVSIVLLVVAGGLAAIAGGGSHAAALSLFTSPVVVFLPIIAWVDIATCVKRLHDTGISGWAYLMIVIPFVGGFLSIIVMGCLDGTMGPNKFGPSPKFPDVTATGMIFE